MGQKITKSRAKKYAKCPSDSNACSDEVFMIVSTSIGEDTKFLGRALGISEAAAECAEITKSKWGLERIAFNLLNRWRRLQGDNATEKNLASALMEIERIDIVEKTGLTEFISKTENRSSDIRSSMSSVPRCSVDPDPLTKSITPLVDETILMIVSDMLGKDWKELGHVLGLTESMMDCIELDEGNYGAKRMAFKSLEVWRRKEGDNATMEKLTKNLTAIQRMDIVNKISPESLRSKKGRKSGVSFTGIDSSITLTQLQTNLRQKYKTLRMKGLPWMTDLCLSFEDHYVNLEMVNEKKIRPKENAEDWDSRYKRKTIFDLKKIIPPVSWNGSSQEQKSWKILVEGDAGFGKTTIASKLCYDYGNEKEYTQQFDVVLLFPLRNFVENFDKMICKAAFVKKEQLPGLFEIINNKSVRTLIILDGYDELAQEHVDSISPLIRGEILPHICLVVTSRPDRFTEKKPDPAADVEFDLEPVWDYQYKLIGLNEKRQAEFVKRHLKCYSPDEKRRIEDEIKEIKGKGFFTSEFLKCPLFFLMVVMVLSEANHELQHVKTMTQLYKNVLNFIIRRYLTKYGFPDASKADLFTFDHATRPFYIDLMAELGEISLSAIKTEQLFFSQEMVSKLDSKVLKLGILTLTSLFMGLREVVYYEPVHKSLIEFAAAYYLLMSFTEKPRHQWNETIVELTPTLHAFESLLFPFLAGLMGNKGGALFDAIKSHADEYVEDFDILFPTLREVHVTDSVITSLIPFLPPKWHIYWVENDNKSSNLFSEIMLEGLKAGKIKEIIWHFRSSTAGYGLRITEDIKVAKLTLRLSCNMCCKIDCLLQRIQCQYLVLWISSLVTEEDLKAVLAIVMSIHFQHISFSLDPFCTPRFLLFIYESVINGTLNQTDIHEVYCELWQNGSNMLDNLIDLIKTERVESLVILVGFLPSQQQLQILFESVAKSFRLTKFEVKCQEETCPLAVELSKLHKGNKSFQIYNTRTCENEYSS